MQVAGLAIISIVCFMSTAFIAIFTDIPVCSTEVLILFLKTFNLSNYIQDEDIIFIAVTLFLE